MSTAHNTTPDDLDRHEEEVQARPADERLVDEEFLAAARRSVANHRETLRKLAL